MALRPGSEQPDVGAPDDYAAHHPTEHPSDWGWHGEWGRWARIGGWVSAIILILMITTTQYNGQGTLWLILSAAGIVAALVWDINRRRTSWRQ
ncbi:MAG: DUF2631 domain-containing protein [Actinomycetota bacterium]